MPDNVSARIFLSDGRVGLGRDRNQILGSKPGLPNMRGQLRVPDNVFGGAFLTGWLLGLGRGWWQLLRTKHGLSGKRDEGRRVLDGYM